MKQSFLRFALLGIIATLTTLSLSAQDVKMEDIRQSQLFNFGWKFYAGDVADAQRVDFDDSAWRPLDLPHDFQIEQPWDKSAPKAHGFKAPGTGWYRKTFTTDAAWKGKRVFLDFEGILMSGDVWVNGVRVGGTDYGYLGFESDITPYLKPEGNNTVAVRASTECAKGSRWYTGGGIYRDVHVFVKDAIAIARHGIFIHTPEITDKEATVSVQVEVEGITGKRLPVDIEARIFAPDGTEIASIHQQVPQKSKKSADEVQLPLAVVGNPQLWSCETPHLYSAQITLSLEGKVLDRKNETFGIRTLEFSPEFGFKLNGKKVILKGISNHHDLGAVGVAAHERAIDRQFEMLKAFGFNHIRTSHNPYSESFLRLADKHGILIVDELFDKWGKGFWAGRIPWTELWPTALTEWVKRDRNRPSLIMWSLGNELQIKEDWIGYNTGDWGITTYRILDVMLKRYDPTRKSTVGMFPARRGALTKEDPDFNVLEFSPELATVTDIASYNYRYPSFPAYAREFPHLIFYQSEAATNAMGKAYYGMDLDKVVGLAYWGAIEYWGESNGWPWKGWHYSYFDHSLQPYPQAYFIKSIFSDEPLVHIGVVDETETIEWNDVMVGKSSVTSHWNRAADSKLGIVTYTNADEVELFVNGKSMGVQKNTTDPETRNMILWKDIPYSEGKALAIARRNGQEVARHQLETTGKAVALKLVPENSAWKADGMDLQYVRVTAVDGKGRTVPTATGEVTFDVTGAARLIAVDNGDHQSEELFAGNKRLLFNGTALCILRSEQTAGKVTLAVSVPGLKSAKKILIVQPN